jgi:hypothetical protein
MAKSKNITFTEWLRVSLVRVSRAHFLLLAAYAAVIIVFDAWHVLVPEIVMRRWIAGGLLLAVVAVVWYLAHNRNNDVATYKRLTFMLIMSDIVFTAFNIYLQRGMASKAVLLFTIPIAVSAILLSRAAIFATAALCAAAYVISTVMYFTLNFNEGYKTELYGEIGFYSALFFVLASILSAVVRFGGSTADS